MTDRERMVGSAQNWEKWEIGAFLHIPAQSRIFRVTCPNKAGRKECNLTYYISRDGKWIAYGSNETGRFEVYVRPFPGPGRQWPISTNGGNSPRWRADGRELYFVTPDKKLMGVAVTTSEGKLTSGAPEMLFQTHMTRVPDKQQYDVTRDGRFLVLTELREISTQPIHLLLNWKHLPK